MHFLRKYKNRMIVIGVAIILLIIMGITGTGRDSISKIENAIGEVIRPIGKVFYSLGNKGSNFIESIKNTSSLKSDNEKLLKENADLKEENRNYQNVIGQKEYLKKEFDMLNNKKYDLLSSDIIGKEPGNWFDRFTIDKGLNDGVKNGDIIVQAVDGIDGSVTEGIVGRVVEVGNNLSKVASVVDENSKIAFKIIRNQEGGVLEGQDGKLTGFLFDAEADVKEGDELFTSGLGGVFSKDLYIGKVTKVIKKDEELMKTIEVEPAINFKKLYRVFVISNER